MMPNPPIKQKVIATAVQATLMQSAIANSAAGTPLHSPRGMSRTPRSQSPIGVPRSGRSRVASASSDIRGSVSSPPTRLSACNSATDLASKPGGGSSEAADVSPTAAWLPSRSGVVDQAAAAAAPQQAGDTAAISALREELEVTRCDPLRHSSKILKYSRHVSCWPRSPSCNSGGSPPQGQRASRPMSVAASAVQQWSHVCRAERDAAREVAKRAAGADAPGLAELWRQLLETEAAARAAAAAAARMAFVAGTPGAASEGGPCQAYAGCCTRCVQNRL